MKKTVTLHEPKQAHKVLAEVLWPLVKNWLICGGGALVVTVKLLNRTLDQNAKFHAICEDLARSNLEWFGKKRSAAQWKVLMVSGHAVATKEDSEIVPGIEGELVSIRESTALMSRKRSASLIEYSLAFWVMQGVTLSAREDDR